MKIGTRECPPDRAERLTTGTNDVLEIFDAHSDYDMPMRVSVLAGVLAIATRQLSEAEMLVLLQSFGAAVATNRRELRAMLKPKPGKAETFMAQLQKIIRSKQ